ncbi:MAG TPA: hypothetical protein DCS97_03010 [Planctomycetes bacterium]|nr:hypothetical protein [Planctomycetota bacterium]
MPAASATTPSRGGAAGAGWGAHPLYHCLSGFAGIRPSATGFAHTRITPRFGPLRRIRAEVPHPRCAIYVDLERDGTVLRGTISSPVPGTVIWNGAERSFAAGAFTF